MRRAAEQILEEVQNRRQCRFSLHPGFQEQIVSRKEHNRDHQSADHRQNHQIPGEQTHMPQQNFQVLGELDWQSHAGGLDFAGA